MEWVKNHLPHRDRFKFSWLCFILFWIGATYNLVLADAHWTDYWTLDMGRKSGMEQCASIEPEQEPEAELEPESNPVPEPASTADESGFCEKLIQRHEGFCKKHPDLCRAALIKCKRSP